jgi:type II secretory pathway component PulJ
MWFYRHKTSRKSGAFTLIEMVLATALAASVMVALLGVLARVARRQERAPQRDGSETVEEPLLALIETDLLNADAIKPDQNGFSVKGLCRLDRASKRISHLPAVVTYQVREAGGRSWLVRRQTSPDAGAEPREESDLVCLGVEKLTLAGKGGPLQPAAGRRIPQGWVAVPRAVILAVTFTAVGRSDGKEPVLKRVLHMR